MKKNVLLMSMIILFNTISESSADDITPTSGTCNTDETCLWSIDSAGTLTISAKDGANDVIMDDYYCYANPCNQSSLISRPWEASLQQIKSVVIGDNITHIGDDAFQNASNLISISGMKNIKTIGDEGVFAYTGLTEITIPDGVTYIGSGAFAYTKKLKSVTLPDTISDIGIGSNGQKLFKGQTTLVEINCLNTSGQCEKLRGLLKDMIGDKTFNIISPTSNCETYNSKGCTSCEKEYSLADGMCWAAWEKKHYTPAEANQWLKDDNNTITITFKK